MIKSYRHTGIIVQNIKRSEKFYTKLLSLKKVSRMIESGDYLNALNGTKNVSADVLKVRSDDNVIVEIAKYSNLKIRKIKRPKTMILPGTSHMCFTVKDIKKLYKKLKKNRVKFFSPPLKSPYDPVTTCFCYDPDNYLIQFVEGAQVKSR